MWDYFKDQYQEMRSFALNANLEGNDELNLSNSFLGYSAYIGYILIEHMQTNPVLRVFIHLLNESAMQNRISCSWSSTYGRQREISYCYF